MTDQYDVAVTTFSPVGQGYSASSHGTTQVSGVNTSGTPGGSPYGELITSGPFFVETQLLDIDYARVPYDSNNEGHALTLSGYNASGDIGGTDLSILALAEYKVEKVVGEYYTSSFLQLQKFEIQAASADINGVTYGPCSVGASSLGPAGKILTKQKWYNRRLWNEGVDSVMTCSVYVSNRAYNSSGQSPGSVGPFWTKYPQYDVYNVHEYHYKNPLWEIYNPINNFNGAPYAYHKQPRLYPLQGRYAVSQEISQTSIWRFLDQVGASISANARWRNMVRIPPLYSEGYNTIQSADYISIPQYSESRHDYT